MRFVSVLALLILSGCDYATEITSEYGAGKCTNAFGIKATHPATALVWRGTNGICIEGIAENGSTLKICAGEGWICEYEDGTILNEKGERLNALDKGTRHD